MGMGYGFGVVVWVCGCYCGCGCSDSWCVVVSQLFVSRQRYSLFGWVCDAVVGDDRRYRIQPYPLSVTAGVICVLIIPVM